MTDLLRYDFRPEGLPDPELLAHFPSARAGGIEAASWPYLRKAAPHVWRTDVRHVSPFQTGLISLEEALILHRVALDFAGSRALEIGCHFGWSTAHLVAAGLDLDVIDPALADAERMRQVAEVLDRVRAAGAPQPRLWAGYSPALVGPVAAAGAGPYAFAFIDGNHDGDAPRRDAEAVAPTCAPAAAIMFHDLNSPHVAAGLDALADLGWETGIYETMQIMGIAWRGGYEPPRTARDPAVPASPAHLARHEPLHKR